MIQSHAHLALMPVRPNLFWNVPLWAGDRGPSVKLLILVIGDTSSAIGWVSAEDLNSGGRAGITGLLADRSKGGPVKLLFSLKMSSTSRSHGQSKWGWSLKLPDTPSNSSPLIVGAQESPFISSNSGRVKERSFGFSLMFVLHGRRYGLPGGGGGDKSWTEGMGGGVSQKIYWGEVGVKGLEDNSDRFEVRTILGMAWPCSPSSIFLRGETRRWQFKRPGEAFAPLLNVAISCLISTVSVLSKWALKLN